MTTLFWILVGTLIGWHVPEPTWARYVWERLKEAVGKFTVRM